MPCGCPRPLRQDVDVPYLTEVVLPHVLAEVAKVSDMRGREGGVFQLMRVSDRAVIVAPMAVGTVPEDKLEKYTKFAGTEKPGRLLEHPDHCLSWQSRDPDNQKWGGAFNDDLYVWSFSGLSEEQDEALVIMAAHLCGRIMNGAPEWIAKVSDNRIILDNGYLFWWPKDGLVQGTEQKSCPSCGGTGGDGDDCCEFCGGSGKKADFRVPTN